MLEDIEKYIEAMEEDAIPQLSVNCVIVGFHKRLLKVVANNIALGDKQLMVLPGGYVKQKEDLSEAVERIVKESTGLENMLFRQFDVFGKASRSFASELAQKTDLQSKEGQLLYAWMSKRFISLCYIALVDHQAIDLKPTEYFETASWIPVDQSGILAMDHGDILQGAREFLAKELPYTPIASNLLPAQFTLPELLALMEAILQRNIDRPNFRRKILSRGILEKVGVDSTGNRRPADLYRFKHGKNTTLMDEFRFGF